MAIPIQKTFGGQPKLVTALGRDGRLVSPSQEVHVAVRGSLSRAQPSGLRRTIPWGTQWWQLDGPRSAPEASAAGTPPGWVQGVPSPTGQRFWPPSGGSPAVPVSAGDLPAKIVTWLILPVVICLSQRLSHACLSISNLYGETANGSLNQLSFI